MFLNKANSFICLQIRAHLVSKSAQDQLHAERALRAKAVVDKFQWITAATVFTNPIPALDLMATGAVQFQMISELAGVYGVELSTSHVKMIGSQRKLAATILSRLCM